MGALNLYNMENKTIGSVEFPKILSERARMDVVHRVVVGQLTNRRSGTARVKTRHEVVGSTQKIYRQKGTGRARHGDIKAPLFVGGGRAFGPKPRRWRSPHRQATRREGFRSVLAEKGRDSKLWVLDEVRFEKPKTKEAVRFFNQFKMESALVVLDQRNEAVEKSIRNLPRFKVCRVDALNVVDMVRFEHLLMTRAAYEKVLEALS